MKQINFKIFEFPTHQVLLSKDYDDDDEMDIIQLTFFIDGVKITQKYGYNYEQERNNIFDTITEQQIEKIFESTEKMFTDEK